MNYFTSQLDCERHKYQLTFIFRIEYMESLFLTMWSLKFDRCILISFSSVKTIVCIIETRIFIKNGTFHMFLLWIVKLNMNRLFFHVNQTLTTKSGYSVPENFNNESMNRILKKNQTQNPRCTFLLTFSTNIMLHEQDEKTFLMMTTPFTTFYYEDVDSHCLYGFESLTWSSSSNLDTLLQNLQGTTNQDEFYKKFTNISFLTLWHKE